MCLGFFFFFLLYKTVCNTLQPVKNDWRINFYFQIFDSVSTMKESIWIIFIF